MRKLNFAKSVKINSIPEKIEHIIQRKKIILNVSDESQAADLQDRVSRLFKNKIHPLLDRILSDFFPADVQVKMDRLELDLGTIKIHNFERQILDAIEKQLPLIFTQLALSQKTKWVRKIQQKSDFELLDYYLRKGYFPWWKKNTHNFKADLWVKKLLKKDSFLVQKFLSRHLKNPTARQRLNFQLSDTTFLEVKQVMMGTEKLEYDWYLDQLMQLHQHVKIRATTKKNYQKYLDELLLSYLGQRGQIETGPQDFGRYFLENVSQRYHLPRAEIYGFYQDKIPQKGRNKKQNNWLSVLRNWTQEDTQSLVGHRLSLVEMITIFLEKGIIPNQPYQPINLVELENLMVQLSEEGHGIWVNRIKRSMESPNVLKRISEQLKGATKEALLKLLYGGRLFRLIKTIQEEIGLLLQIKKVPPALEKKLVFFYQNALLYFYTDFNEQTDFSHHFIIFLKDYLEKAVPLNWGKWWDRLSQKQQGLIRASPLLVRFFSMAEAQKIFSGNLALSTTQLIEKLEQIPEFIQFLTQFEQKKSANQLTEKLVIDSQRQLQQVLNNWSQSKDFFQKIVPQLSLIEIANIAKIIAGTSATFYQQKLEIAKQVVQVNPLPRNHATSGLTDMKLMWLATIKVKHQAKYHGNREKRFWNNWISAMSVLLGTSEETLWIHFQKLPKQEVPSFSGWNSPLLEEKSPPNTKLEEGKILTPIHLVQFLDTGRLTFGWSIAQLDREIQTMSQRRSMVFAAIFKTQLGQLSKLKQFRKLAPKTIQCLQENYFKTISRSLETYFQDFSKIVRQSKVLPVLSMFSLHRDIRLGLLYAVIKQEEKISKPKELSVSVLQVISRFHAVTYATLLLDLARVVQKERPTLASNITTFFKSIDLPKITYTPEQTFFYFLKLGAFPEKSSVQQVQGIEEWLLNAQTSFSAIFTTNLLQILQTDAAFIRVITQFSEKVLIRLNQRIAKRHWGELMKIMAQYKVFFKKQSLPNAFEQQLEKGTNSGLLRFLVQHPKAPYNPTTLFHVFEQHLYFLMDLHRPTTDTKEKNKAEETVSMSPNLDEMAIALAVKITKKEPLDSTGLVAKLEQLLPKLEKKEILAWVKAMELLSQVFLSNENQTVFVQQLQTYLKALISQGKKGVSFQEILRGVFIIAAAKSSATIGQVLAILYEEKATLPEVHLLKQSLTILRTEILREEKVSRTVEEKNAIVKEKKTVLTPLTSNIYSAESLEKIEQIIAYLNTGKFGANKIVDSPELFEKTMSLLLEKCATPLFQHLKKVAHRPKALDRIKVHLTERTLASMVENFDKLTGWQLTELIIYWLKVQKRSQGDLLFLDKKTLLTLILQTQLFTKSTEKGPSVLLRKLIAQSVPATSPRVANRIQQLLIDLREVIPSQSRFQPIIEQFATDWKEETNAKIPQVLQQDLTKNSQHYQRVYEENTLLTIVDFYLENNQLPWWYTKEKTLGNLIVTYATLQPNWLRQYFQKIWQDKTRRAKILAEVDKKDWQQLAHKLYPSYISLIQATVALTELAIATARLTQMNTVESTKFTWAAVLDYFWQYPTFSSETFVVQTLTKVLQTAKKTPKKWLPILQFMADEQVKEGAIAFGRLSTILLQWQHQPDELKLAKVSVIELKKSASLEDLPRLPKHEFTRKQNQTLDILQAIQHFLVYGVLPKTAHFQDKRTFVQAFTNCLKKQPQLLKAVLTDLLTDLPVVIRLMNTFSSKIIWAIIRLLYGVKMNQIDGFRLDLLYLLPGLVRRFNREQLDEFFQFQLLTYLPIANKGLFQGADFFSLIIERLAKQSDKNPLTLLHQLKEKTEQGQVGLRTNWNKLIPQIYKRLKDQLEKNQQRIKWSLENKNKEMKDEILYVNNAGLSVIAPFLPRYFKMLKMTNEKGKFLDEGTASRAVHLLQYMVTGQTETEEPLLIFNKLLVGLPIATPVPKSIELTPLEKETTHGMLQAILAHWKGIGTSSLEGLRGGFLIRDGRLEWHEDRYWNLDVEKKAYDVVMQSLPWSISMIQFPWLDYRVQVTWF